ncbi:YppE family protein [Paenalkalicoccus suaedae]|uniref:YppE family protein n=1 Tax=Paenalkalicoccus suaedae TaxID=2592382 RepID=A0A859FFY0_9BACI|nr:YppE family protein [Paenalkalicoccus suaedae]QKS71136.1 YppE family protein [Paenalkalicoccus suaedae]
MTTIKAPTDELRSLNQEALQYFMRYREGEEEADFFQTVKPFADSVHEKLEWWTPQALKLIEKEKPAYLHAQQIDQLVENFEVVSVTCFQKDTKRKRFKEQVKSIEYTLQLVIQTIDEQSA